MRDFYCDGSSGDSHDFPEHHRERGTGEVSDQPQSPSEVSYLLTTTADDTGRVWHVVSEEAGSDELGVEIARFSFVARGVGGRDRLVGIEGRDAIAHLVVGEGMSEDLVDTRLVDVVEWLARNEGISRLAVLTRNRSARAALARAGYEVARGLGPGQATFVRELFSTLGEAVQQAHKENAGEPQYAREILGQQIAAKVNEIVFGIPPEAAMAGPIWATPDGRLGTVGEADRELVLRVAMRCPPWAFALIADEIEAQYRVTNGLANLWLGGVSWAAARNIDMPRDADRLSLLGLAQD